MMSKIKIILFSCVLFAGIKYLVANTNQIDVKPQSETISQVMAYQMPNVIKRCQKDFGYSDADMIILEKELKRYLSLCIILDNDYVGMYSKDVDNLWHSFILFTREYAEFSKNHAGRFLHHAPEINDIKTPEEMAKSRDGFRDFIKNYKQVFGEEAHNIWFLDIYDNMQPDQK